MDWMGVKDGIEAATGLSRDALHVYAAFLAQLTAALLIRRSLAHPLPWLCVLLLAIANEYADIHRDDLVEDWELPASQHDLWNTMLLPSVLLVVARFAPRLMVRRAGSAPDAPPEAPRPPAD